MAIIAASSSLMGYVIYSRNPDNMHIWVERYAKLLDPMDDVSFRDGRIERWKGVVRTIMDHPIGFGTGFTQFQEEGAGVSFKCEPFITESIFFDVCIQQGIVAGVLFALVAIIVSVEAIVTLHNDADALLRRIASVCVLLLVVPGIASPNFAALPFTYYAVIALGILKAHAGPTQVTYKERVPLH